MALQAPKIAAPAVSITRSFVGKWKAQMFATTPLAPAAIGIWIVRPGMKSPYQPTAGLRRSEGVYDFLMLIQPCQRKIHSLNYCRTLLWSRLASTDRFCDNWGMAAPP